MTWKIPLTRFTVIDDQRIVINLILDSTMFTEGFHAKSFEERMASYIGVKHCIACANGTAALTLIFHALKEDHDRIIVPALTFPATLNPAINLGYKTVLKDCSNKDAFVIDHEGLENLKSTDIVVPVHLLGYPVKMDKILEIQKKIGYSIIEDCCESIGTQYNYKRVGSFGNAGAFSFYPTHCIQSCGELGCITTNDTNLAIKIRSIKNHGRFGSNLQFRHKYVGYNLKCNEMQAAFAERNLWKADEILKQRQDNVKYLNSMIKNKDLILPKHSKTVSYLCYPIGSKSGNKQIYIDALNKDNFCETRDMFPCLANQEAYKDQNYYGEIDGKRTYEYEKANYFENNFFYITVHQDMSEDEMDQIAEILNKTDVKTMSEPEPGTKESTESKPEPGTKESTYDAKDVEPGTKENTETEPEPGTEESTKEPGTAPEPGTRESTE